MTLVRGMWICAKQILKELAINERVTKQDKSLLSYLAMLSPLKNRAMSWSEDCHGKPLARITVSLSTVSDLLLHRKKKKAVSFNLGFPLSYQISVCNLTCKSGVYLLLGLF